MSEYKVANPQVTTVGEWVLGPEGLPFFTTQWYPKEAEPKAYILFVHGFAEHITRYHHFFNRLASSPYNLHITAFDQRGHGRTAYAPLLENDPIIVKWKEEGKKVVMEKNTRRKTGGWAKVMPDIEFFVKRESERAKSKGKALFLHGFSMGGGEVLAFATRPQAPPSAQTVALLSGVIAGGALIRQTNPASALQVKAGSFASQIGFGSTLIPTPLNYKHLSHNEESNLKCKADPFCEQKGSLLGVGDMLNGGISLDTKATWDRWPSNLPLLVYHGDEDPICDYKAAQRFHDGVKATKAIKLFKGMYHEVHNELDPTPDDVAKVIGDWVLERIPAPAGGAQVDSATNPKPNL